MSSSVGVLLYFRGFIAAVSTVDSGDSAAPPYIITALKNLALQQMHSDPAAAGSVGAAVAGPCWQALELRWHWNAVGPSSGLRTVSGTSFAVRRWTEPGPWRRRSIGLSWAAPSGTHLLYSYRRALSCACQRCRCWGAGTGL